MAQDDTSFVETDISFILHIADFYGSWSITFHPIPVITFILGMSNRLKPYNRLLGQVSDRVPGYSVENLFCSV